MVLIDRLLNPVLIALWAFAVGAVVIIVFIESRPIAFVLDTLSPLFDSQTWYVLLCTLFCQAEVFTTLFGRMQTDFYRLVVLVVSKFELRRAKP